MPKDADVANAIGAITSSVVINKQLRIIPGEQSRFIVEGIAGTHQFKDFDNADYFARKKLVKIVREMGQTAGTSYQKVVLKTEDQFPVTAGGDPVFMGKTIYASLTGRPDIVVKKTF